MKDHRTRHHALATQIWVGLAKRQQVNVSISPTTRLSPTTEEPRNPNSPTGAVTLAPKRGLGREAGHLFVGHGATSSKNRYHVSVVRWRPYVTFSRPKPRKNIPRGLSCWLFVYVVCFFPLVEILSRLVLLIIFISACEKKKSSYSFLTELVN